MILFWFLKMFVFQNIGTYANWVEIPQKTYGPIRDSGVTLISDIKTPINVVFHSEQIEKLESFNVPTESTTINKQILLENDTITKSSILEIFATTEFTPLMSSVNVAMTGPVTTPTPTRRSADSRNLRRNKTKKSKKPDEVKVKNNTYNSTQTDNDNAGNREIPEENIFSTYTGFMPFIRSIQNVLLQKAHKSVKSKIEVLKNLRDNLLYEIDQRIKRLWQSEESSAREYKDDSHIEFPSNEGALMTIGFLTLAVFLVKLVLQVIAAIKAKKSYYSTTTTTTASTGRKKRYTQNNYGLDDETTYRILNLIDTYEILKMTESEPENWLQKCIDLLDIIGMYSKDTFKTIRLRISFCLLIICNIAIIFDLILNCETLEKYIENLTSFLPAAATFIFLLCFVSENRTLQEVVNILRYKFPLHNQAIEAEIICIRLVKYSKHYLHFVMFLYILLTGQSYLEREERANIHDAKANGLPLRFYVPVDLTKPHYFILCLVMQLFGTFIVIHATIPIAVCFAALLIHLRGQLFYLQECLITVCNHDDPEIQRKLLKKCIEVHILLIHFTDTMQKTFSNILAIHNYSPSIVISVVGYQASMMSVLSPKFLPYISTVNYVLAECFVYCYFGQHIIDQSSLLGFVAYSNKWYNCPPDVGKDLKMIIMRCQKPLQMKFLGSTSSSLETYYNIVKTGYSYFMFLASMGSPKET